MHPTGLASMKTLLALYREPSARVLDVGSYDVNGTFRPLIEARGWQYTGLDIAAGPNVDIVTLDPYHFPIADEAFDLVISGSTMEHVGAIWRWIPELVRVLRRGGYLAITTHWQEREHRYPVDCWRVLPDGMRYILEDSGLVDVSALILSYTDIGGCGWKP